MDHFWTRKRSSQIRWPAQLRRWAKHDGLLEHRSGCHHPDESRRRASKRVLGGYQLSEAFPDAATGTRGLWDIITHELGHVLCLPHSDDFGDGPVCVLPSDDVNHTMYSIAQYTTTQRFLKPHDVCRLQVKYSDRTDQIVAHRYDADGAGAWSSYAGFDFPADPQDGVGLAIDTDAGATYYAVFSDVDSTDYAKMATDLGGVDWDDLGSTIGGGHTIQVPAAAYGSANVVAAYLYGATHDPAGDPEWFGSGTAIWVKVFEDDVWSDAIYIGQSWSGPALAYRGNDCFLIAFATTSASCPDCIRTMLSCDGGYTWGNTYTSSIRTTDRPAVAWRTDTTSFGGILWTTNVTNSGARTGNHLRHGLLRYEAGPQNVQITASTAEASLRFTSNFPALAVSDFYAPQPRRYVRVFRSSLEAAGGRNLTAGYIDDIATQTWSANSALTASRSPPSASYSILYNEYWTLFTR